jgi:hypothetical protein
VRIQTAHKIMLQYLHSSARALRTYWQECELNFVKGWKSLLGYDTLLLGEWFLVFQRWLIQGFATKQVQQLLCLDMRRVRMMRCAEGSHFMTHHLCWSLKQPTVRKWKCLLMNSFECKRQIYTLTEFLNLFQNETNATVCLRIEVQNDTSAE